MRLGTRKLTFAGIAVLVGTLAMLLSACGSNTSTGKAALPDSQQIFKPLDAGAKNGDLDSFDPALIQFGGDYYKAQLVFPPFVTFDNANNIIPWGADKWETSSDGLTWTFHIHPGMKWSDGSAIDANTYAYSMNRSLDPCTASGVGYYLSGTGAELIKGSVDFNNGTCPTGATTSSTTLVGQSIVVTDPLTLKITLSNPAAYFLAALTYPTAWAQPKQLITQFADKWTDHLADNGGFGGNLFKVKLWDHAGHFDLIRNDSFWGKKPKLKEVDFTLYKDLDTEWADYKAGKGDYFSTPPPAEISIAKAMPGFQEKPDITILYITPNWALAPFDDVRVRQAFDLALDRTANAHVLSHDTVIPTIHMVIKGLPGYNDALKDPEGRSGDAALTADPAKAGALWKAYVDEKFGGDASKAPKVAFAYRAGSATAATNAAAYQQQWQSAMPGLQVTLVAVDRATQVHKANTLQITTAGWIMDYPDPQDFLTLLVHSGSAYNQTAIKNAQADALMDKADANSNNTERLQQYQQAEQLLVNDVAWIPTGQNKNQYLTRPTVAGGYVERASESPSLSVYASIYMTAA